MNATQAAESPIDKATLIDVQLATAYFPILVEFARSSQLVTYGDLVEKAKSTYPDNPVVQKAIAVSTGRRLDIVREFTIQQDLPDITSLVISQGTGECGIGFTRTFDPVAVREAVFAFDWSNVTLSFGGFVAARTTKLVPRKKVNEDKALEIMSSYFYANKASLPESVRNHREYIVERIMEGFSPDEAFAEAALLTA